MSKCGCFIDQPDSESLVTNPCLANRNPAMFSIPQTLANLHKSPWQTKGPDNFNMSHMFSNNIYFDFKLAHENVFFLVTLFK